MLKLSGCRIGPSPQLLPPRILAREQYWLSRGKVRTIVIGGRRTKRLVISVLKSRRNESCTVLFGGETHVSARRPYHHDEYLWY